MRTLLIATTVVLLAGASLAQTPFTLQGIGQNVEVGTARDVGRGGWGVADRDTLAPGLLNPAALADLRFKQLVFTGTGEGTTSSTLDEKRSTWRTSMPGTRLAIPLRSGLLAVHAGFNVKRSFYYETTATVDVTNFGDGFTGEEHYYREGNIYEIPLGLAWRPLKQLAVAASANFVRGPIEDRITQIYAGPLDNEYIHRLEVSGRTATLAALWDAPGPFSLGASFSPGYNLDIDRTISMSGVAGEFEDKFDVDMPPEYKAGVVVDLGRKWRFGVDGVYAAYGETGAQEVWTPTLRDEWTVAAGFERQLFRTGFGRSYRMPLRFGFMWRRWAYQVGDEPIDERVVSIGSGVPFRNWLGSIDASLSYAWIGSEAKNGLGSKSVRLGLSISGLERLIF